MLAAGTGEDSVAEGAVLADRPPSGTADVKW
jgi:hypothetical protein